LEQSQQFGPSYLELPPREIFIVSTRGKSGEDDTPSHANLGSKSCEKVFCEPEAPRYSRNGVSKPVYFTFEGLTPDSTMDDDRDEQENVQMLMENDPVKVIRSDIETHDREMETFSCINSGSSGADNPAKENLWQAERVNTSSPPSSMEPDCIRNLSKPMSYYYTEYESLEEEVPFDEDPICHKFSQNNMSLNAPTLHHPPKCLPDRIAPILTPIIEVNSPICSPYEDVKEKEKIKMVQSLSPAALDVDEDNDNEQVDYVPTLEDTHVSSREEGFPSKIRGPIDTSQSLLDQEVVGVPSDEIHGPRRSESSEGSSTCNYASNEFCRHLEFFQFLESLENDIYDN
jgi:hypothetical protein